MANEESSIRILASGKGEFRMPDPDGHREYVRANKPKGLVNKVMMCMWSAKVGQFGLVSYWTL